MYMNRKTYHNAMMNGETCTQAEFIERWDGVLRYIEEECGCVAAELTQLEGEAIIDFEVQLGDIELVHVDGETMVRAIAMIPYVFDCWVPAD